MQAQHSMLVQLATATVQAGASDLHLTVGRAPTVRRDGTLVSFENVPVLGDTILGQGGVHWFLAKAAIFCFMFLWIRATFPRYRYDQIMRLGWKVFVPICIFWILVTAGMVLGGVIVRGG